MKEKITIKREDFFKEPELKGKVYTQIIFAEFIRDFIEQDMYDAVEAQVKAENWILEQAKKYGVFVGFVGDEPIGLLKPVSLRQFDELIRDDEYEQILHNIFNHQEELVHEEKIITDLDEFKEWLAGNDIVNYIMMMYATLEWGTFNTESYVEHRLCVISTDDLNPYRIAHQILESFGAISLRDMKVIDPDLMEELIDNQCRNDVMLARSGNLLSRKITDFTAWCLGWHDRPKGWYKKILDVNTFQ